jgi:hypothetical protein
VLTPGADGDGCDKGVEAEVGVGTTKVAGRCEVEVAAEAEAEVEEGGAEEGVSSAAVSGAPKVVLGEVVVRSCKSGMALSRKLLGISEGERAGVTTNVPGAEAAAAEAVAAADLLSFAAGALLSVAPDATAPAEELEEAEA